ncbi:MAG: hypothetical protein QOE61_239 [Micromonosporaceae bacterium]|nr:hypothetical protein [Micromonosporaceae bacterium]
MELVLCGWQPHTADGDHARAWDVLGTAAQTVGALTTPAHHGDEPYRSAAATLLRSAANDASVAADILASHIDPTNGPRTPQGTAIRLGAGRTAALAEVAVAMT